jgi:hypothetical protein
VILLTQEKTESAAKISSTRGESEHRKVSERRKERK